MFETESERYGSLGETAKIIQRKYESTFGLAGAVRHGQRRDRIRGA